jgi:aminoglycoside phosphotransferase (APT) family kinase protein
MRTDAAPTPAALVAAELLDYLQIRKGIAVHEYAQPPEERPDGWEAYTYRLQLRGPELPPALQGPLALRVYAGPEGLPRLRRDWALQRRLSELHYPVAGPVLREEDCAVLGGPFMLMEWVEGDRLFDLLLRDYIAVFWGPMRMADVHAQLHELALTGLPLPVRPLLDRQLEAMKTAVEEHGLTGLAAGVEWLQANRPQEAEAPCLLHLDFHAKNLLMRRGRCAAVLDWSESDVGDRHADVGVALLMIDTAPVEEASWWNRQLLGLGRHMTRTHYLWAYRRHLPLDRGRLRYYQAWAAMRRLSWYARWFCAGPREMGYKPEAPRHVRPEHVADVERYFERYSGVAVKLGLPAEDSVQ